LHAVAARLLDDRAQLLVGELPRRGRPLQSEHARRRRPLDHSLAVLELVAHGEEEIGRTVGDALLGTELEHALGVADVVAVPAGHAELVDPGPNARPDDP